MNKSVPFAVPYACRYWVYHLNRSDANPQEHRGIAELFEARFLFWVETLALISRLADGIAINAMLQLLETRLFLGMLDPWPRRGPTLGAVVYDAKRFMRRCQAIHVKPQFNH